MKSRYGVSGRAERGKMEEFPRDFQKKSLVTDPGAQSQRRRKLRGVRTVVTRPDAQTYFTRKEPRGNGAAALGYKEHMSRLTPGVRRLDVTKPSIYNKTQM